MSDEKEQPDLHYSDAHLKRILQRGRTIAMVGASAKWNRPSSFAMKYLQGKGYKVIPVNPAHAGGEILGEKVYASLADVPGPFQVVDIFRRSDAAGEVADEAVRLAKEKGVETVWMQLGVRNDDAARRVEEAGLNCIMDRCMKIEYGRLFGELGWGGVNSRVISSKRPKMRP
jgi:predicted CoA-binding protein